MMANHLKILPVLIFVAMLAFSVRVVDVVTGVSSLSGAAFAEEKEEKAEAQEEVPAQEGGLIFADDEEAADAAQEEVVEPPPLVEDETLDWRDASESDLDFTATRMELFDDMAKRRKELEKWEKELMTREALLRAAKKELDQKYQELSQLRTEIEKLLEKQSEEEQTRITSLVKIYEGMKAKDAANIFNTLDLDVLIAVMSQMSERKLSPILAEMNPERARTVTIMLAEQKQLPSLPGGN